MGYWTAHKYSTAMRTSAKLCMYVDTGWASSHCTQTQERNTKKRDSGLWTEKIHSSYNHQVYSTLVPNFLFFLPSAPHSFHLTAAAIVKLDKLTKH